MEMKEFIDKMLINEDIDIKSKCNLLIDLKNSMIKISYDEILHRTTLIKCDNLIKYIEEKIKLIKQNNMKPTREQLIECYDIVFNKIHSPGFKEGEMKCLIYDPEYRFIEQPNDNWDILLKNKLNELGFNLDVLRNEKK